MARVLRFIGIIFASIGALFTAIGIFTAYAAREPILLVFCAPGGIFLILGIVFLCVVDARSRTRARLLAEGERIDAQITDVRWDFRVTFNGRHPLVIDCQTQNPADGRVYVFHSEGIWFDPTPYMQNITALPVYVDPDNYHRYVVDLSGILPQEG